MCFKFYLNIRSRTHTHETKRRNVTFKKTDRVRRKKKKIIQNPHFSSRYEHQAINHKQASWEDNLGEPEESISSLLRLTFSLTRERSKRKKKWTAKAGIERTRLILVFISHQGFQDHSRRCIKKKGNEKGIDSHRVEENQSTRYYSGCFIIVSHVLVGLDGGAQA